ncbi:MAG: hypothetical protein LBK58_05790 [Prevotellaceae bacterium]|jgi:hypothetical protein|nr:hypothetical protein [Prevotellaceae bacterium]
MKTTGKLYAHNAMQSESIQKNEVSLKNLIRRRINFLLFTVLATALCLGFSSCSKDDDEGGNDSIAGLWRYVNVSYDIKNPSNTSLEEEQIDDAELVKFLFTGSSIEFKADNSFVFDVIEDDEDDKGTYSDKDGKIVLSTNNDMIHNGSVVTLNSGVLSVTQDLLDEKYEYGFGDNDAYMGKTFRELGFTKFTVIINFRK